MSWAEVKKINSNMSVPLDTQITSAKNAILSTGAIKCVKSVQRGMHSDGSKVGEDITISSVNINKSLVIAHGMGSAVETGSNASSFPCAYLKNSTTLHVAGGAKATEISWQVIEFY